MDGWTMASHASSPSRARKLKTGMEPPSYRVDMTRELLPERREQLVPVFEVQQSRHSMVVPEGREVVLAGRFVARISRRPA